MGKHISILQGGVITTLTDDVDKELLDYAKDFKNLFDSEDKILIIKTTNEVVIIRPSTIDSIKIKEL